MASSPPRGGGDGGALKVNDPVHVERDSQRLEGVVAFLGKVSFAEGDDWVGVRLTGASVGMGKNDGSVKGTRYFNCGPNCGVFVRKSHISKRTLSRLEELRLRRELAKSGGSPSSKSEAASSRSLRSSSSGSPTSSASATRARLEELRKRREEGQQAAKSTVSRSIPSPTRAASSKSNEEIEKLQTKIKALETEVEAIKEKLQSKEEENTSLQESVTKAQQEAEEARSEAAAAKENADEAAKEASKNQDASKAITSLENAKEALEATQEELFHTKSDRDELQDCLSRSQEEAKTLRKDLTQERNDRKADADQLTKALASASALELELQAINEQANVRGAADSSHYKEKAMLQAELGGAKRRVQELETEKQDMETTVEELALDKEQLQEEKDALEDKMEELKIDAETAQMEVVEMRLELEDAKSSDPQATADSTGISAATGGDSGAGADADDVAQALSVQNARLREALIRLREQSSVEKMELSRELRAAEKDSAAGKELSQQVETLRTARSKLEEEINDLKDMVEQGSAFETMVEDLSDRVMALEDDNVALQSTIREMEEAADITAEMEEVQADENKALMKDVEERETVIRNLEEAIRLQRRREEDFQRTVGNYRTSVETLKQEKSALLELQKGGEGEKSHLLASSQKALARASHLVADAANVRKREAEAAVDRIEAQQLRHLSDRLESFLPQIAVSSEVASLKGELLLSKVTGKASLSLDGIATIFTKKIRVGTGETLASSDSIEGVDPEAMLTLADEAYEGVGNMLHQAKFALATTDIAADLLRLLAAGQWPDLLSPQASAELGSLVGHSISDLDVALGDLLRTLKEEGVLSPHQTNLASFEQSIRNTMEHLNTSIDGDENLLLPSDWKPPGWQLFKDVSVAKFSCLGAGAAVAAAVGEESGASQDTKKYFGALMTKLDQVCGEASKACVRLARLNTNDEKVPSISETAGPWKDASSKLLESVQSLLSSDEDVKIADVSTCEAAADEVLRLLVKVAASLRAAGLNAEEEDAFHPLSPEADDPWEGVSSLSRAVRSIDGDEEDVNFLVRSRTIEQQLSDAVANEPKLTLANAKVASLEKSVTSRSKEIAIQNARLSELERLLARESSVPSPKRKSAEQASSEEMNSVKEENRVLTEAMDVLQRQVDEYEREIRFFKDSKSPKPSSRRSSYLSKRSVTSVSDYSTDSRRGRFDLQPPGGEAMSTANIAALETALYRPALQSARREAAAWKSKAFVSTLMSLPPLDVPQLSMSTSEEKTAEPEDAHEGTRCLMQLEAARSYSRLTKASMSVVNLAECGPGRSSRAILRESLAKQASADKRLEDATALAARWLSKVDTPSHQVPSEAQSASNLVGRIRVPGSDVSGVVPVTVKSGDLYRMHLHLFQ